MRLLLHGVAGHLRAVEVLQLRALRRGSGRSRSGQRGLKAQPGGGSSGLGTSPATGVRALPLIVMSGIALSQHLRVGVQGPLEERPRGRDLDDAPEVHHAHAVGDVRDHREVVRDEEVGEAVLALQVLHEVQDLRLHGDVQRARGLVAHEELGIRRQRPRDRDALALAAGELVRELLGVVGGKAHVLEQLAHALLDGRLAQDDAVLADGLGDDPAHAPARVQARVRVLEDHLEAPAHAQHLGALRDARHVDAVEHARSRATGA